MEEENLEMGVRDPGPRQPPDWTYQVEEVKYTIDTLKEKIRKLAALQTNLLRRPSLDDNTEEERELSALASEIKLVRFYYFKSIKSIMKISMVNNENYL